MMMRSPEHQDWRCSLSDDPVAVSSHRRDADNVRTESSPSLWNPHHVNQKNGQDAERTDREPDTASWRRASSVTMPVSELTTISSAATSMVQYQTLPVSKPL